jgi:hypothetical protein
MASSFLLCCVLAATVAIASGGEIPLPVYEINGKPVRGMQLMTETDGRELADEWDKLKEVPVPDSSFPEKFYEWLQRTEETVRKNWRDYKEGGRILARLEDMIELGYADSYCPPSQMRAFLLANKANDQVPSTFRPLANYLNHCMPRKLAYCAESARGAFPPKDDESQTFEHELDEFYGLILDLPEGANDEQLYEALRDTDLLKDKMNFAAGLEIAQSNIYSNDGDSVEEKINAFLFRACKNMRDNIGHQLSAILLSDAIEGRVESDHRLLKLIEYDHACYYVTMNEREFTGNVRRQLSTSNSAP